MSTLLASCTTFTSIKSAVAKFYCTDYSKVSLVRNGTKKTFHIYLGGEKVTGTYVRLKVTKGIERYHFRMEA